MKIKDKENDLFIKAEHNEVTTGLYFQFNREAKSRYTEWFDQMYLLPKELIEMSRPTSYPVYINDGVRQYIVWPDRIKIVSDKGEPIRTQSHLALTGQTSVIRINTLQLAAAILKLRSAKIDAVINARSLDREVFRKSSVYPFKGNVSSWLNTCHSGLCYDKKQLIKTVINFCKHLDAKKRERFLSELKRFHGFRLFSSNQLDEIGFIGNNNSWFNGNGAIILRDNDFSIHT